jgi:radical SAM superfamily enzyme
MMLKYADEINRHAQIKFVKFHHLHIVEGSVMGVKYKREPFKLFGLDEYAEFLCELLPRVRPDIIIQRLFGLSDRELLIAPNWGLKKKRDPILYRSKDIEPGVVQGSAL